jgi:hypothetical protein
LIQNLAKGCGVSSEDFLGDTVMFARRAAPIASFRSSLQFCLPQQRLDLQDFHSAELLRTVQGGAFDTY